MQRHSSVKAILNNEISPEPTAKGKPINCGEFMSSIKKLKQKRKELESMNYGLKNKVNLLEKEDKKVIDKIFYIKNLQAKVTQARETLNSNKRLKEARKENEKRDCEELKRRNLEFKNDIEVSKQKAIEALKLRKEQLYQEGRKIREKALEVKVKSEKKLKTRVEKTKQINNIGKLWLIRQQEQRSQLMADRLQVEQKDEVNRLKKAKREFNTYRNKEQAILSNFQRDQAFQETVLEEFKNTINQPHAD